MGENTPYGMNESSLRLAVRLTPKAGHAGIRGIAAGADDAAYMKGVVTVPAEGGKANRALIKLLARELRLSDSSMHIASGAMARKQINSDRGRPGAKKRCLKLFCRKLQ